LSRRAFAAGLGVAGGAIALGGGVYRVSPDGKVTLLTDKMT
jgi:hypothetical protein